MNIIRGIIKSVKSKASRLMRIDASGRAGETIENREMIQQYGFASSPRNGSECVMDKQGNSILIIATDDRRYKMALNDGEVALYVDQDNYIKINPDGKIEVQANSVVVNSGDVTLGGSVALATAGIVTGECTCAYTGGPHPVKSTKVKAVL